MVRPVDAAAVAYYQSVDEPTALVLALPLSRRVISRHLVLHNTSLPTAAAATAEYCWLLRSVSPTEGNFLQFVRAICAASDNKRHQFRRRHGHSTCFRPSGGSTGRPAGLTQLAPSGWSVADSVMVRRFSVVLRPHCNWISRSSRQRQCDFQRTESDAKQQSV